MRVNTARFPGKEAKKSGLDNECVVVSSFITASIHCGKVKSMQITI